MSIKVMTDVWQHSKAAGTDLLVLLALADNANDEGECWPSIRYVALKCRIDTRTTQRRIRSLKELGEVIVIYGGGKASTAGGTKSNRYRIVVHLPEEEGGGDLPGGGTRARDGVAPVPGDGVAPVPPEPSVESSVNRQSLAPATANAGETTSLRHAIISACGLDPTRITSSAEGAIGKAVKDIAAIGGSTNDVNTAAEEYRVRYPQATLTPLALAKHWPSLVGNTASNSSPRLSTAERFGLSAAAFTADPTEALDHFSECLSDPTERARAMEVWTERREAMAREASASELAAC